MRTNGQYSKSEVSFEHPAQGPHHCSQCKHFMPKSDMCRIVAGMILPGDWCKKFEAKNAN